MKILLKNGRVIDPKNHVDEIQDLLMEDGKIAAVLTRMSRPPYAAMHLSSAAAKPELRLLRASTMRLSVSAFSRIHFAVSLVEPSSQMINS